MYLCIQLFYHHDVAILDRIWMWNLPNVRSV